MKDGKPVSVKVVHPKLAKGYDAARVPGPCTITSYVKPAPKGEPLPEGVYPEVVDGRVSYQNEVWITAELAALLVKVEVGNFRNIHYKVRFQQRRIPGQPFRTFYSLAEIEKFALTYKTKPRKQ